MQKFLENWVFIIFGIILYSASTFWVASPVIKIIFSNSSPLSEKIVFLLFFLIQLLPFLYIWVSGKQIPIFYNEHDISLSGFLILICKIFWIGLCLNFLGATLDLDKEWTNILVDGIKFFYTLVYVVISWIVPRHFLFR